MSLKFIMSFNKSGSVLVSQAVSSNLWVFPLQALFQPTQLRRWWFLLLLLLLLTWGHYNKPASHTSPHEPRSPVPRPQPTRTLPPHSPFCTGTPALPSPHRAPRITCTVDPRRWWWRGCHSMHSSMISLGFLEGIYEVSSPM